MPINETIRQRLGLSQQELADLLGISRDLFAQCEVGRRSLPTNVLMRMSRLEILLHDTAIQPTDNEKEGKAISPIKDSKKLVAFARQCSFEADKALRKLERIEKSLSQGRNLLNIISSFRNELTEKSIEMAAADLVEQKALANQKKFTEEHLTLLRIQISGLRFQAEMALASAG